MAVGDTPARGREHAADRPTLTVTAQPLQPLGGHLEGHAVPGESLADGKLRSGRNAWYLLRRNSVPIRANWVGAASRVLPGIQQRGSPHAWKTVMVADSGAARNRSGVVRLARGWRG